MLGHFQLRSMYSSNFCKNPVERKAAIKIAAAKKTQRSPTVLAPLFVTASTIIAMPTSVMVLRCQDPATFLLVSKTALD